MCNRFRGKIFKTSKKGVYRTCNVFDDSAGGSTKVAKTICCKRLWAIGFSWNLILTDRFACTNSTHETWSLLEEHHPPAFKRSTLLIWFSETTKTMIHSVCSIVRIYTIVCDIICNIWNHILNIIDQPEINFILGTIPHWTKIWVEFIWGSTLQCFDVVWFHQTFMQGASACLSSFGRHPWLSPWGLLVQRPLLDSSRSPSSSSEEKSATKSKNQMTQIVLLVTIVIHCVKDIKNTHSIWWWQPFSKKTEL